MTRIPPLAGLAEVASIAGVSRQRAGQITAHPDFPEPVQRLAMGPVWLEADVKAFLAVERKPGRRRKTPRAQDCRGCNDQLGAAFVALACLPGSVPCAARRPASSRVTVRDGCVVLGDTPRSEGGAERSS